MFLLREKEGAIHSPMDLSYMRKIRFWLHFVGSWPWKEFGISRSAYPLRHSKFLFLFWSWLLVVQVLYIRSNTGRLSFFDLGHCYITALMNVITIQRMSLNFTKGYGQITKEFVEEVHLYHHRNMSDYAMKTYQRINKLCVFVTNFVRGPLLLGVLLFNGTPLWHNIKAGMFSSQPPVNGTYIHSSYYILPFDYVHNFLGYFTVFIANWFLCFDVGVMFCYFDLYIALIMFHIWGHLKILRYHIENFPRPRMVPDRNNSLNPPRFTKEQAEEINTHLIKLIEHHKLIKNFWNNLSTAFGSMLCVYMAFHEVCGCILLVESFRFDTTAIAEYSFLTMFAFQQLIQTSILFEIIGSESETLGDAVYSLPWESMDVRNMKEVLFFLRNVQEPLRVKAMGLVPVGVQTMAGILKTSISYFIMLRTMSK